MGRMTCTTWTTFGVINKWIVPLTDVQQRGHKDLPKDQQTTTFTIAGKRNGMDITTMEIITETVATPPQEEDQNMILTFKKLYKTHCSLFCRIGF